jgi:multidrug resistance efflux pump
MAAAMAIFNAIRDGPADKMYDDPVPMAEHHLQRTKRHHRHCCRKLDRCIDRLDAMQRSYASACFSLDVYQRLAESITYARNKDDLARRQWLQRKIKAATQCIKDNSTAAQHLLHAEIAGLKSTVQTLEVSYAYTPSFRDA